MKIYKLDIDVAKPINKMVAMQQNTTGMLVVTVTKDGGYIRNATCSVYDGENEITPYYIEDNHYWFKVDVGIQKKNLTVKFNATPITSTRDTIINVGTGGGMTQKWLNCFELAEGTYRQDEFLPLANEFTSNGLVKWLILPVASQPNANFNRVAIRSWHPIESERVKFYDSNVKLIPQDVPIVATGDVVVGEIVNVGRRGAEFGEEDYPSVGYYTDYQMDTLVNPSVNAPYDGNYVEPLTEVEVDGVKFVPTTLSVDGVDYKVLAEAVDSTDTELDSTDSEVTDGDGE